MSRSKVTGPLAGSYNSFAVSLASNASTPSFIAPSALRVMEVAFYARTSTSGTITITSTSPNVTIQASGSLTADTPIIVAAASLTNRTINKGSTVKVAGGGTLTDGTCVITCQMVDHVVSAGELPDAND